jgi:hypothetical protein
LLSWPRSFQSIPSSLSLVVILTQIIPVHTLSSFVLKIQCKIIQLFMPSSSGWPLAFRFPYQNSAIISFHSTHATHSVSYSRYNQLNSIWWQLCSQSSWLCSFLQCPATSSSVGPQHPLLQHPQPMFFP